MVRNKLWIVALLFSLFLEQGCAEQSDRETMKKANMEKIAFMGANIIPMTSDTVLQNYTVLVDNGNIVRVGETSAIHIPNDYTHLDVADKYMLPGFIDMHVHLSDDGDMLKFVQHGVTTVRNMSDVPWWTHVMDFSNILKLREKQRARKIIGPDIYTCGFTLDGNPPVSPMNTRITNAKDAEKEVTREKKKGYDAIKLYDNLSLDAYKAVISAAAKVNMPVCNQKINIHRFRKR